MIKAMYVFLALAIILGLVGVLFNNKNTEVSMVEEGVVCTAEVRQCPDGSEVGRSGPNCEFVCPEMVDVDMDLEEGIGLVSPVANSIINSPLKLKGRVSADWLVDQARFSIGLLWEGVMIAEGYANAVGDWENAEQVSFMGDLTFTNPYSEGGPETMKNGTLVLKKNNPSGLSENDHTLEVPIRFAP